MVVQRVAQRALAGRLDRRGRLESKGGLIGGVLGQHWAAMSHFIFLVRSVRRLSAGGAAATRGGRRRSLPQLGAPREQPAALRHEGAGAASVAIHPVQRSPVSRQNHSVSAVRGVAI